MEEVCVNSEEAHFLCHTNGLASIDDCAGAISKACVIRGHMACTCRRNSEPTIGYWSRKLTDLAVDAQRNS